MRVRMAGAVMAMLVGVGPAAAQRSLGELGGPIQLDREPPAAGATVIDQHALGPVAGTGLAADDPLEIAAGVDGVRRAAGELQVLCDEAARNRRLAADQNWWEQFHQSYVDLAFADAQLQLLRPPQELADPWRDALAVTGELLDAVRPLDDGYLAGDLRSIRLDEPVVALVASLDRIAAEIEHRRREVQLAAPPEPLTAAAAAQIATSVCRARFVADSRDERLCLERQRQAADAIQQRFSFTVGLDDATFNRIRTTCAGEYPADLAGRDGCEQSRMGAAAGG